MDRSEGSPKLLKVPDVFCDLYFCPNYVLTADTLHTLAFPTYECCLGAFAETSVSLILPSIFVKGGMLSCCVVKQKHYLFLFKSLFKKGQNTLQLKQFN